jgi:hypothetical protein
MPELPEQPIVFSNLISRAVMALTVVFIVGIVWLITGREGAGILIVGSVISGITLWKFMMRVSWEANQRQIERSWSAALTAYGAFVPYVFGCYLVFYRGFWGLTDLSNGFSILVLLRTAFFVILGFAVVNGTYMISEAAKMVTEKLKRTG